MCNSSMNFENSYDFVRLETRFKFLRFLNIFQNSVPVGLAKDA